MTTAPAVGNRAFAIRLLRRIYRAHRRLPRELRFLGDSYVRKEFRDHRNVDDHATVGKFLTEWQKYLAVVLPPAPGAEDFGERLRERRKIDARLLDAASDQQLGQLWELRKAALRGDAEGEPALPPAPSAEAPRRES